MVKRGAGTLTLGGMSALDWSVEAGGLVTSAERMAGNAAIASGASLTLDQAGDAANASRYSGAGALIKTGGGMLTLNADSSAYTGSTVISGGGLRLADGAKLGGSLRARAGTTLSGTGQLGATTIDAGATHAPGNPTGAQAIAGDYVNRGTLLITATPAAQSRLDVAGRVDIGGATLDLRLSPDDAAAWQPQAGLCADLQAGRRRGRGQFRQRAQSAVVHGRQRQQHGRRRQRRHAQPDAQQAGGQSRQHRQSAGRGDGHRRLAANP